MRRVKAVIAERQKILRAHPFFRRFQSGASFEAVMSFAPHLTFWVLAFQDILRLNYELIFDRKLRRIALYHRREDAGHDDWFIADLRALGTLNRDISFIFGPDHAATRAAAYGLVSEVYRASDDRVRLALVLAIESAGHAFFETVTPYVERHGKADRLTYFAPSHLAVEHSHNVFGDEATEVIDEMELPEELLAECRQMVERVFHAFIAMFDALPEPDERRASVPPAA